MLRLVVVLVPLLFHLIVALTETELRDVFQRELHKELASGTFMNAWTGSFYFLVRKILNLGDVTPPAAMQEVDVVDGGMSKPAEVQFRQLLTQRAAVPVLSVSTLEVNQAIHEAIHPSLKQREWPCFVWNGDNSQPQSKTLCFFKLKVLCKVIWETEFWAFRNFQACGRPILKPMKSQKHDRSASRQNNVRWSKRIKE